MEFRLPFPFTDLNIKLPSWSIPLLFSLAAGVWIWQNGTQNQLITKEIRHSGPPELLAFRFGPNGDLIGRSSDTILKWSANENFDPSGTSIDYDSFYSSLRPVRNRNPESTTPTLARVSNDGTQLALYAAGTLAIRNLLDLGQGWICSADVEDDTDSTDKMRPVSVLSFTDTGLVALGRADGTIEFRDPRSRGCQLIGRTQTKLSGLNVIRSFDRYLAVASSESRAIAVLDLRAIQQEISLKSFPLTSITQLSLAVSSSGRVAVSTGGPNVFVESQSGAITDELGIYGPVRAIAFADENRIIAGGDYQDIYLLEKDKLPQLIAKAPLGTTLIAANATHIAFADVDGVTILSRTNTLVLTKRGRLVLGLAVAGIFLAAAIFIRDRALKARRTTLSYGINLPDKMPDELVRACSAGECVVYGGAGLSARARLPVWKDFVHGLLDWSVSQKIVSEREAREFHAAIDNGEPDPVADTIVSKPSLDSESLRRYLRQVFGTSLTPLTETHRLLKSLNLSGVLTTNFDTLLERLYDVRPDQVFTPRDAESLLNCLTTRRFFLLKLYGALDKEGPVMVAPAQYEAEVTGNRLFSQFMETLLLSRTLLFIGASLDGIHAYLRGITLPASIGRQHFAVVAVEGSGWRAKADVLKRRYGIEVLPYTASAGYPELDIFLRKLGDEISVIPQAEEREARTASRLKRVTLENIGAFEKFELELDTSWQVLLGDNGVGKSTILKAIALALVGETAERYGYASRLLRSGKSTGRIVLETDQKTSYATELRRINDQEVEIRTSGGRPLTVEGWFAIGFPPLRTVGWSLPGGPGGERVVASRTVPEDLLPLVAGDPDPRLDKLKVWIVDLEFQTIQAEKQSRGSGKKYQALINEMFRVINSTMEGLQLTYTGVEPITNRILVEDETGIRVPLEALSQGTTSLIGWVGVLMQRLYEVFGGDAEPTKNYALVLMDELDAHMHPVWQQILVSRLKTAFPNAQFIATTHSPLVVGGMPARQVLPLERDKTGVRKVPITPDVTFGYVDQRLTSPLFRMDSALPESTTVKLKRYRELLAMKDRGPFQAEFEELEQQLLFRIPPRIAADEQKRDRMVEKAELLKQIGQDLAEQQVEGGGAILERAEKLRSDLERGPEE